MKKSLQTQSLVTLLIQGRVVKYADNIYTGGSDIQSFLDNVEEICHRLSTSNLRANPAKVIIGITDTTIMGWHWSTGTLTPSVHKLNPLSVCEKPQTITGLRSFLGGMRFHKRCLQGVDNVSQPLDEACPATKSGKDKIDWTPEMTTAFEKCQEIMKSPKSVVVPRTDDQLVQVADGALHLPAVGSILVVIRPGVEGCLPVGYFGFRIKGSMQNWSPCELEAYTHAVAMEENSIYFRESQHPPICLSDNSAVVDASKKIKRGLFSASPRLQTLFTAIQRYGADFRHISGKLPTDLINVADFSSRNPVECSVESCKVCNMSREPDTSFSTIRYSDLSTWSPVTSRQAWKAIQESCPNLRLAAGHIHSGTRPGKKEKNMNDVRKLISKASVGRDGLLVVKETLPMDIKPVDLIVVPRDFSLSVVTLLHNDSNLDHPSVKQMLELTKRKFYIFDRKRVIQEVFNNCLSCAARRKISPTLFSLETQTKSECPGTQCNADVLVRDKQKILILRDNLTSFTQTKFIPSEQKDDLRSGLISLVYPIKPNMSTTIRVDPHSSFKALKDDKILAEHDIFLEIGHEKNVNKNSVAEKGIQELEHELLRISPTSQSLNEISLAKATHSLNSRIRYTHKSARELLLKRDQFTGHALDINDKDISDLQFSRRSCDNKRKISSKSPNDNEPHYIAGDIVFVISDKDKHKNRDAYVVIGVEDNMVEIVKATNRSRGTRYKVKTENVYKAISSLNPQQPLSEGADTHSDTPPHSDQIECFYCKRCGYSDYQHDKKSCYRYQRAAPPQPNIPRHQESYRDSDSDDDWYRKETHVNMVDDNYAEEEEELFVDAQDDGQALADGPDENQFDEEGLNADNEHDFPQHNDDIDDAGAAEEQIDDNPAARALPEVEPQFRDPPVYVRPKKGEVIEYFQTSTDGWASATIISSISGYKNSWFNIEHEDNSKCSVELTEDTVWRYEDDAKKN